MPTGLVKCLSGCETGQWVNVCEEFKTDTDTPLVNKGTSLAALLLIISCVIMQVWATPSDQLLLGWLLPIGVTD